MREMFLMGREAGEAAWSPEMRTGRDCHGASGVGHDP